MRKTPLRIKVEELEINLEKALDRAARLELELHAAKMAVDRLSGRPADKFNEMMADIGNEGLEL